MPGGPDPPLCAAFPSDVCGGGLGRVAYSSCSSPVLSSTPRAARCVTSFFRNSAGCIAQVSEPGISSQRFQIVSKICHFVRSSAANPHHQAPKTPVVEHKGNASHLTADYPLRAVSLTTFSVQRFNRFCCTLCNGDPGVTYGPSPHLQSEAPMATVRKQKAVTHGLRYNAELNNRIEAAAKKGGFSSHSAFIRAAIERELAGRRCGGTADRCESGSHGPRNSQSADRTAGVVRVRRRTGEDILDLCSRTAEGCARPGCRPRQSPLRPISQERRHGHGG